MDPQTLAAKRQQYRRGLEKTLQDIVCALAQRPEVRQAILFGSYTKGRRDLFTDLDILIVMDSPLDFVTRTADMYRYLSLPLDVDLLAYTPQELDRARHRGFIRRALEEGSVIYEKRATE
jgi:predicted nucleotidyltransferase